MRSHLACKINSWKHNKREIRRYVTSEGKVPFAEWFDSLRDTNAKAKIISRLNRVTAGNLGDYRSVGEGVCELRIKYGPRGNASILDSEDLQLCFCCVVEIKVPKTKIFTRLRNIGQIMKEVKMPTSDSYYNYLIESLRKEPELAAAYITATLEEQDPEPELLKMALSNVAEALGEQNLTPEQAKLHP
jgi:putative component of toxin-antitoxin plasmid stabilization module